MKNVIKEELEWKLKADDLIYTKKAKEVGANECINFNWSEDVNETCHCLIGKDFVTKKCLLLDNKECNCMALSA